MRIIPTFWKARNRLARLNAEEEHLENNARTLEEAGSQLKAILAGNGGLPRVADLYNTGAPRLALIAHLMGATPLLGCAKGCDYTEQVDREVKFLAAVAAHRQGHLPPIGRDLEVWERVRGDFRAL